MQDYRIKALEKMAWPTSQSKVLGTSLGTWSDNLAAANGWIAGRRPGYDGGESFSVNNTFNSRASLNSAYPDEDYSLRTHNRISTDKPTNLVDNLRARFYTLRQGLDQTAFRRGLINEDQMRQSYRRNDHPFGTFSENTQIARIGMPDEQSWQTRTHTPWGWSPERPATVTDGNQNPTAPGGIVSLKENMYNLRKAREAGRARQQAGEFTGQLGTTLGNIDSAYAWNTRGGFGSSSKT